MIKEILKEAINREVSDIILSANKKVAFKKNGEIIYLDNYNILTREILNNFLMQITNKSQQDKFFRNLELDFGISFSSFRFRVNVFGVKDGIGMVFRLIPNRIPKFEDLLLPEQIKSFINKANGIVLVTGSVGSGKTTTLASLLNEINLNQSKHIITIEDPIEFVYENGKSLVEQREIGLNTLSFENGLKYVLRQAPDVILIGEMRDLETFRLALRAAETGNLVFATLHTAGAARTIARIIDMFPAGEKDQIRSQLSDSLLGVVWQKLLKKEGGGRIAATEVLFNNTAISNLIRKGETHKINSIIETSKQEGMISMKDYLNVLLNEGLINEEIFKKENSLLKK